MTPTGPAPRLRPATPADEGFLLALTDRLAEFEAPPWRTATEIRGADHRILREALRQPTDDVSVTLVEDPPGTPAGYFFCTTRRDYFTAEPVAHVEVLVVRRGAQGRGLGRVLMDAAEVWARGRGIRQMSLNVFAANTRARELYRHLGYREETVHYLKRLDPR
jgi:GNAT superfamily N-acetyltransferase